MKRILSVLLALTLVLSLSLTSFAAVTITHSFRALNENGEEYVYHFGTFDKVNDKEVGLVVGNNEYKLDDAAYEKAVTAGGKFGIGLIDKNNVYGGQYTVTPYSKAEIGGERTEYASKDVVENDYEIFEPVEPSEPDVYEELPISISSFGVVKYKTSDNSYKSHAEGADDYSSMINIAKVTNINTSSNEYAAAYFTLDISELEGIADNRKVVFNFKTNRGGSATPHENNKIYLEGVLEEPTEGFFPTIADGIFGDIYSADIGVSSDAKSHSFNITSYIKNKILLGEETATLIIKGYNATQTVSSHVIGRILINNEESIKVNPANATIIRDDYLNVEYADKTAADSEAGYNSFYDEVEIGIIGMGVVEYKSTSYDIEAVTPLSDITPANVASNDKKAETKYDSSTNTNVQFGEKVVYQQFDISDLKGVSEGRKVYLNVYTRRSAGSGGNANFVYAYGVNKETTDTEDITAWKMDDSILNEKVGVNYSTSSGLVKEKIDITDYVKARVGKSDTMTIMLKAYYDNSFETLGTVGTVNASYIVHRTDKVSFITYE